MTGEGDAIAKMLAELRQLAEEYPEAAERLAADLAAAVGQAGMRVDGQKITEQGPASAGRPDDGGAASEVAANQER